MIFRAAANKTHTGMITLAVMLGTLLQVLDTTIVNVSLPEMQGSLSADQDQISWVLTSYIIGAAIMTPPTGWLAGRFGRRRVFLVSMIGFLCASFLCGTATSLAEIVVLRVIQGLFGAAMVPISQAIMLDTWPREKHGMAMAIFGIGLMLGPIIGPVLGAYLTEDYSWRWVFFINIPIGALAILLTLTYVKKTAINLARKFDGWGFLFLSVAIGALQMMLDRGEQKDWFTSAEILIEFGLVVIGTWLFFTHSYKRDHPYIDLTLFRDRNYVVGNIIGFIVFVTLFSTLSLLPQLMQEVLAYPVILTGLILAPRGIGTMISMMVVGRMSTKIDPRFNMAAGIVIMALGTYFMSGFDTQIGIWPLVWTGFLQGVGMGQVFVPLTTVMFSTLPPQQRTEGTGVYNLIRNIGGSLGISIGFTLLARYIQVNHAVIGGHITPYSQALQALPAQMNLGSAHSLAALNDIINQQAAMISFNNDFLLMSVLSVIALPLVFLMKRPIYSKPPGGPGAAADSTAPARAPLPGRENVPATANVSD
ncbi:MAG TPA: DHA2 family efflux MFS transporter permease subunit [Gammaproteobacteria bacterium]|nr:DHA2 family efflux MFS transporter permease subunit [Gammaproteobacteria bacterium]